MKAVANFASIICGLLGLGATPVQGIPQPEPATTRHPGEGVERAAARLAAKRKANEAIPSGYRETRQQRRAANRKLEKETRGRLKDAAMSQGVKGGSAVIS